MNDKERQTSTFSVVRAKALIYKETKQMLRDKSTLTLGVLLPIILLLLFGYGLSLDVKLVPLAIVHDNSSPLTSDLYTHLSYSKYFEPSLVYSYQEAEHMLKNAETKAIVRREANDSPYGTENIQIIVNGRDSNTARIMQIYLQNAISQWNYARLGTSSFRQASPILKENAGSVGQVEVENRIWYNLEQESRFFLVPGLTVLIMTIIGSMLTSLVIAREWERGTYEALIATPVHQFEIILGKTIPYFMLGLCGLSLCLFTAYFIFEVPMRGSFWLIVLCSAIYLIVALAFGLVISAATKSQFLANQVVLVTSFLPVVMLSGFIFDIKSAPAFAYYLSHIFPSTWYVSLLQTLFLVGDIWYLVLFDTAILLLFALFLLNLTRVKIKKTLK